MRKKLTLILLAAMLASANAFAAVGVVKDRTARGTQRSSTSSTMGATDLNFIGIDDAKLKFDGSLVSIDFKPSVYQIAGPTSTPGLVTAARSGSHFVLTGTSGPAVGGIGYILTLPAATEGLNYKFTTSTNQTLGVRTNSTSDIMYWGTAVNATKFTSPASTGSTMAVVAVSGKWYITAMESPAGAGSPPGAQDWVAGTR